MRNDHHMDPDLAALDRSLQAGMVLAERDQALADVRNAAQVVQAYLEGLEDANVEEPLRSQLVRDFAAEYWRRWWPSEADVATDGCSPHD